MPESIPETPNPGSYSKEKKEIQVAKWGTPKNIKKKKKMFSRETVIFGKTICNGRAYP